jgi:hypothetical protein
MFDAKITMNGAVVRVGDEVVYKNLTPWRLSRPLLTVCEERGIKAAAQSLGMDYANFKVDEEWWWIKNYVITDLSRLEVDAEKIYALPKTPDDICAMENALPDELYMVVVEDGFAMVMHRDATKSKAVMALARHFGVGQKEIAAFGDDLNDIDLLEYAGTGVAVANAHPSVKAAAGAFCASNMDDGPARWIEEHILHK